MVYQRKKRQPRCQVSHGVRPKLPPTPPQVPATVPSAEQGSQDTVMVEREEMSLETCSQDRESANDQNSFPTKAPNKIDLEVEYVAAHYQVSQAAPKLLRKRWCPEPSPYSTTSISQGPPYKRQKRH